MERFKRLENLVGSCVFNELSNTTVLVLGVGGVGSFVVEALARSNVGKLIIVDYDKVDITNINRQIMALDNTIGKYKTTVMKKRIELINKNCNVLEIKEFIDNDNIDSLFKDKIDYVVDACDTVNTKKLIIKECKKRGISIISSMGTARKIDATKLEITDISKTCNDPLARIIRKYVKDEKIGKLTVLSSRELPIKTENNKELASCMFVPATAGILIANYVVKDIIKKTLN